MSLKITNIFYLLLLILLTGCEPTHYQKGLEFQNKGRFQKAIDEYNKGITLMENRKLFAVDNTRLFSLYNNLGNSYEFLGQYKDAKKAYLEATKQWPERAYYSFMNLASLTFRHKQGSLLEAIEYSHKAKKLAQNPVYEELESMSRYKDINTVKKRVVAQDDYLQLILDFSKLTKQFGRKKYQNVLLLADKIINKKYRIDLGMSTAGNVVQNVIQGSIADLNGVLPGDQILEIEGTEITSAVSLIDKISSISDRFGDKINIRVIRRNREFTIICYLYFPELEMAKQIKSKAQKLLVKGSDLTLYKDIEPPQLVVLKPVIKRGARTVIKKTIEFVILAGDNFKLESVSINGAILAPSQASHLESSLLLGQVKKYKTMLPVADGETVFRVEAVDTSGNQTVKNISVTYNAKVDKHPTIIYEHSIAVVIGIDKYSTWPSLEFAVSDARAIKEKLYALGFDQVIELYNGEASRLQILRLLGDKLPRLLGSNDNLMIYFAGHGQTETFEYKDSQGISIKEKEGYIIPIDAGMGNYEGTAISMSIIREMSKKYKAKHILYVFDSCYSGLGLKRSGGVKKVDEYIKKISAMKAVQIITAGGENEAVGEEKGHGIFTRHFLMALDGMADIDKDGFITASEIGVYIRPIVSRKTNNEQTPRFGWISGEGDFIFENQSRI